MKYRLSGLFSLLLIINNCHAGQAYIQSKFGISTIHVSKQIITGIPSTGDIDVDPMDSSNYSAGLEAGYLFNPYWGLSLGIIKYSPTRVNYQYSTDPNNANDLKKIYQNEYTNYLDTGIMVIGQYPFENNFTAYGKAGISYILASMKDSVYRVNDINNTNNADFSYSHKYIRPKLEIGVGYAFYVGNKHCSKLQVNLSYSRVFAKGPITDSIKSLIKNDQFQAGKLVPLSLDSTDIPNIDMLGLSITTFL